MESIKGMEQLDKNNIKYQFESQINRQQYNNAFDYLKQKPNQVLIKQLHISLNKQQKNSFQLINDQISAVLIEKQKKNKKILILQMKRFNLEQLQIKKILYQNFLKIQQQNAYFIRLKQKLLVKENNLEYSISKVASMSKKNLVFSKILNEITESKQTNIQTKIEQIFEDQIFTDYEFEIEVAQIKNLNDEQIKNISKELLNQIEYFWNILNFKQLEDEQKSEKKFNYMKMSDLLFYFQFQLILYNNNQQLMSIQTTLQSTQEELSKLNIIIQKLSEQGNLDEITEGMTNKEQIELNLNLAYTLSSIYYSYLKLNQVETSTHPIMNELTRIQEAFQKYMPSQVKQSDQKQMTLNKEAAKRLVQPNLKSLDDNQHYQQKQKKLIEEDKNNATRLEQPIDIWKNETDQQDQNKQKLIRGNLIPQTGHLKWKDQIEKLMKK
ncbi:unnamed protein product [Paramecium sonneborni]|uniref:Nuclear nucleic acid-binding protein C1D n=1 Tax=Paramecium sonneborni TaxID=65129 RepID=A0A8S1MWV4_9CILI|nr:unnamed protein product [Paramecium sonneborni]